VNTAPALLDISSQHYDQIGSVYGFSKVNIFGPPDAIQRQFQGVHGYPRISVSKKGSWFESD
jgi:hypothetical protein